MRKSVRFLSALLTVLMVLTSVGIGSMITASAATPAYDYLTVEMADQLAKLATMTLYREQNGYKLYCDPYTGEIAVQKIATGQILFSNPYDVASATAANSATTRAELLSQIFIEYEDSDGTKKEMVSYTEAAERGQIIVKNIKNGIRVEYTMGRQEARRLVPRMIQKNRFEDLILSKIDYQFDHDKLFNFYVLMDTSDPSLSERAIAEMKAKYPITNKMAVYIFDSNAADVELNRCESIIKTYCPDYTYETLDEDHALTEYEGTDSAPPLFRLAIEYTLDDQGVEARLPANGIRFDDTSYTLLSVTMLPYMGCISSENDGYTFMPDGAGALFTAKDLAGVTWNRAGQMYGPDFAYQQITGEHQEVLTMPVWGAVSSEDQVRTETIVIEEEKTVIDEETGEETVIPAVTETKTYDYTEDKGYVAIITEGDSLATIKYENGGNLHKYAAIYASFCPRPSDEYNLSEAISAASNTTWRVESARKYVDSYRIKYMMLDGDAEAEAAGITDYYETSYFGMAKAYREYLEGKGVLTRLTDADVAKNIPLYLEVLGTLETTEKVLSIPVTVDTPLTTFENIKTMYEELAAAGVDNINFKLTGFANGGLSDATVPYKLKWENAVGGADGFEDLLAYAADKNLGIFPDFDFLYAANNKSFDGFTYRKHAVKTIDDRYTSKRYYDPMTQSFTRNFEIAISPSVFTHFYEKFSENYKKYNPTGISVSTLGTDLNSDFDEDDPYNREDSKGFTTELLGSISKDYGEVMIDGGNSYALGFVDHIVNMNLNSSEFFNASYSVPFSGIVLHGYVEAAGTPANEEGDIEAAILKSIESGTYLYFTLAYQNTSDLKEDEDLNKYYSIRYDIWFEDIVEKYSYLNEILKDLQTKLIVGHELLVGERIPDADELEADRIAAEEQAKLEAELEKLLEEEKAREEALAARKEAEALAAEIESAVEDSAALIDTVNGLLAELFVEKANLETLTSDLVALKAAVDAAAKTLEDLQGSADTETDTEAPETEGETTDEAAPAEETAEDTPAEDGDTTTDDTTTDGATDDETTEEPEEVDPLTAAQQAYDDAVAAYDAAIAAIKKSGQAIKDILAEAEEAAALAARKVEITEGKAEVVANVAVIDAAMVTLRDTAAAAIALYDTTANDYGFAEEEVPEEEPEEELPEEEPEEEPEVLSKYAVTDGSIVLVSYEGGRSFILNFNRFDITVEIDGETYTVEGFSVVEI